MNVTSSGHAWNLGVKPELVPLQQGTSRVKEEVKGFKLSHSRKETKLNGEATSALSNPFLEPNINNTDDKNSNFDHNNNINCAGKISAGIKLTEVTESLSSWSLDTQQYVASRYIISEPTTHLTLEARPILILMVLHDLWIYTSDFQPCIFSLKAQEARCRTRYLDLIISKAILHDLVFTEVKTRITSLLASGDTAEPFIAHQNDLDVDSIFVFPLSST
ncbi:hypothetical protein FB446DRAFT_707134 [Lentinula raphanica]|nr:hypothetical protein FB446DRAFT_707134 [Lentinula raphanica]